MNIEKSGYITNISVKTDEIAKIRLIYGTKKTVEQWQAELGANIVCNGALFNNDRAETPIETYKSDGVLYSKSDWCNRGFGVDGNGSVMFGDFTDWFMDFAVAFPTLVWEGQRNINFDAKTINGKQPRTIFSKTEDGFMVTTIDGRQKGKYGMTIEEAADYMHSLGVWYSANLDGGGSTRVAVNGEVVNSPCENRPIRNVLAIWLKEDDNMEAKTIISKAVSQIGVKENPSGSNKVKYNTEYYGTPVEGKDYPWCCAFVWWVFKECGASKLFFGGEKTAYCPAVETYYKKKGQWFTSNPKAGDLVLFDFTGKGVAEHIGILEKVNSDGTYSVIEGNTSTASNDNGGKVMRRTRNRSVIRGFARPEYKTANTTQTTVKGEKTVTVTLSQLKKGSKGKEVKTLQRLLIALGYSCGSAGADGDFGNGTHNAIVKYQKAHGLGADGIVGAATWNSILKNA